MNPELDVIMVGPVAPPAGGVATHVERMTQLLEARGLSVGILNHFASAEDDRVLGVLKRNPLRYWNSLRRARARVVHYHHARWSTLVAAALARASSDATWVVTFHSHVIERSLRRRVPGVAAITRWAIRRFDEVVAVSEAVALIIREQTGAHVSVIPAYLPAGGTCADGGDRVETAVVSAYRITGRGPGDPYGLDIASKVYAAAARTIPTLRLEIFLAQSPRGRGARRYLEETVTLARDAARSEQVSVRVGSPLLPALRPGAVYLRPTRTDGDAVSIREALEAGVPVIASDVATRPPGTLVRPVDDVDGWAAALCAELKSPSRRGQPRELTPALEYPLLTLYEQLLGPWRGPDRPELVARTLQRSAG
jgi:glycosyltransferase involved in cell wall biosynthesis